jgi:nucleotide-binding universal stress UspA family protein
MLERILVPVDGSELSARAVPEAIRLALALEAPVHLLQVTPYPTAVGYDPVTLGADTWRQILDSQTEVAQANLDRLQGDFVAAHLRVTTEVSLGDPAVNILERATPAPHTLIVMATHGRSGPARWLLGSVAEKVVRASYAPVFLVPALVMPPGRLSRILVPLDGSELAESILLPVAQLGRRLAAEAVLFQTYGSRDGGSAGMADAVRTYLTRMEELLEDQGITATVVARAGEAAEEVIRYAGEEPIDLIAMATHGRSGIQRWALGSVSDKVLHHTPVPVLLYRPREIGGEEGQA